VNVLKNKHVVVAALVAPVLAILAWFAIDFLMGERPKPALEGQSYPLVERSNCRYASGRCALANGDFKLELTTGGTARDRVTLTLSSVFPLDGAMVAMVDGQGDDAPPVPMQPGSGDGLNWSLDIARPDPERQRLRLVVSSAGALYFGDVATAFTVQEAAEKEGF
jgi:hypothetical protein